MRYYPTDKHGNLDEWGAVIKRQAEAYNRQLEDNKFAKQVQAREYGAELQKAIKLKQDQEMMNKANLNSERNGILRLADQNNLS